MYGMSDAYGPSVESVKNKIRKLLRDKVKEVQMVGGSKEVIVGINLSIACMETISEDDFN